MVLWAIVALLVILNMTGGFMVLMLLSREESLGQIQRALEQLQDNSNSIRRAAELWDGMNREPRFYPEPEPTAEEKQRKDELTQAQLRKSAEHDCGGWQTARIVGRRTTAVAFECEFVVATSDRTYIAQGRAGSFYRDGKAMM